jgi:hypothetical protein
VDDGLIEERHDVAIVRGVDHLAAGAPADDEAEVPSIRCSRTTSVMRSSGVGATALHSKQPCSDSKALEAGVAEA